MDRVHNKIAHYNLNLDYKDSRDIETKTNLLINTIINNFVDILFYIAKKTSLGN